LVGLCVVAIQGTVIAANTGENILDFGILQKRLVADGFDPDMIRELYARPQVRFDTKGISTFFTYRESKLNYGQFKDSHNIRKAKKYIETHEASLARAEDRYGVDRYVITAIILVETRLGTYTGERSIFNTLSTMAALDDPAVRESFWNQIPKSNRFSKEKYNKKAATKSKWAYGELKAFLKHTEIERLDPNTVNGSFAGAMGIAQFMPSNILMLAEDGNGDGRIDLFDHEDAIASVANYLKHHGWRPGLDREKAYRVILRYNYSKYYANTILDVASLLKG
jgi:membrane-bound lytic murein transglycosylase B